MQGSRLARGSLPGWPLSLPLLGLAGPASPCCPTTFSFWLSHPGMECARARGQHPSVGGTTRRSRGCRRGRSFSVLWGHRDALAFDPREGRWETGWVWVWGSRRDRTQPRYSEAPSGSCRERWSVSCLWAVIWWARCLGESRCCSPAPTVGDPSSGSPHAPILCVPGGVSLP